MARRHQLTEKEVPEAIKGLHLRLQEHLEKREDLSAALTCYRAYYRLTIHHARVAASTNSFVDVRRSR